MVLNENLTKNRKYSINIFISSVTLFLSIKSYCASITVTPMPDILWEDMSTSRIKNSIFSGIFNYFGTVLDFLNF
tara:strand:+ start:455 stop:679 length:225 start_codon:yes stop_codon:yes gene_type:complete